MEARSRTALTCARVVLALLALAGVVTQLVVSVRTDFSVVSFFSYFTTLANTIGAVVLLWAASAVVRGSAPAVPDAVRGASVVYLVVVGIVFVTLLRDADLGDLRPWVNTVHHYVMPVAVLVDWLLDPPRSRLPRRVVAGWLAFPALYTVYSLVRGEVTGFYAYPFFDPDRSGGAVGVAAYCAVMLLGFLGVGLLVRWLGHRRSRAAAPP